MKYKQAGLTSSYPCCCLQAVSFPYSISTGRQMDELSWKGSKLRWTLSPFVCLRKVTLQHNRSYLYPLHHHRLWQKRKCACFARLKPLHLQQASGLNTPEDNKMVALPQEQQHIRQASHSPCEYICSTGSQHPNWPCLSDSCHRIHGDKHVQLLAPKIIKFIAGVGLSY